VATADAGDRRRARLSLKANIVVEAGAGTGKTTLLADRILFTLLAGGPKGKGSDVTRVVALTFTEKAAGEIKERLHQRLLDLLARLDGGALPENRAAVADGWLADARSEFKAGPDEVRAMARAALSRLDRAMIGTIHGFAAFLLRRHPLEAGVDPGFAVDEGDAFDEAFAAEWALHLDGELGLDAPRKEAWVGVLRRAELAELEALARDLASEAARLASDGPSKKAREALSGLVTAVQGLVSLEKPKPKGNSKMLERLPELLERLRALEKALAEPPALDPAPRFAPFKRSKWPANWADLPGEAAYEEACDLAEDCDAQGLALLAQARAHVAPAAEKVRAELQRRGRVGFDGLLSRARDLVKGDLETRERLKAQFDALLVDEFQDTDPLQGELLLFLAEALGGKAGRWEDVTPGPGRLFVVGDPKQSIYRFRGADIRAYESFTKHLTSKGALACDLTTNFRSHAGLVAPVNEVFRRILTYEEWLQPEYKALAARPDRKTPEGAAVELVLVTGAESEDQTVDGELAAAVQARWAADWVSRGCGPGKRRYKDVAMLFRTAARMRPFVVELKARDIPFAVEAEGAYFGTPEVQDFLCLLRVLADPEDRVSLAGLLRSPMAALEDRELLALAEGKALDYLHDVSAHVLSGGSAKRAAALFNQLRGLHEGAGREPLGRFVGRVLKETFLLENAAAAYHGEQAPANLVKLARLAAEAGEADGLTLREFSARAAELAEDDREGESPLADEGVDAVRLLTMHKAKGLEFPVVFLPELARGANKAAPPGALYDWGEGSLGLRVADAKDVSWHFNDALRAQREEKERVRLLYVAMTRAKETMVLMGNAAPKRRDSAALSALLEEAGAWPAAGEHPEETLFPITWLPASQTPPARRAAAAAKAPVDAGRLAVLWKARLAERDALEGKPLFSAPSAAAHDWDGPLEASDAAPRERAKLVGTLCHRVLERWDYRTGGSLPELVEAAEKALAGSAPTAEWDLVRAEASSILAAFTRSPAAKALAAVEILGREVPFVRPLPDGSVQRGAMDLLYRKDGRVWVADYKTAAVGDAKAAEAEWGEQGAAYAAAVQAATGEPASFAVVSLRSGELLELG
jgi:ATP-dependent helicase/nuclease subunit A